MADITWRHEHDYVRRVPGHDVWIARDYPANDVRSDITVRGADGTVYGRISAIDGIRWAGSTVRGTSAYKSQRAAAIKARDDYWAEQAAVAVDDDPSVAMHLWDSQRHRSQKTTDARAAGKFGVGPSDLNACEKAVEFRENPPEGHEPVPIKKDNAIIGTLLHDAITAARRALYPWREFGVLIDIPGLDYPGECDEYDPIVGRVVDYKSASTWKWEYNGKDGPPQSEWEQVMTYAKGLREHGRKVESVELLYINRETGEWERFVRSYSEPVVDAALGRLHAMMDALEAGDPLPRRRRDDELLGPTSNTLCAKYCPHVKTCWNLDAVPEGRTPEGFLLIHDDDDIAETLERYVEARETEGGAKKVKEYAKTLVTGEEPGEYGDFILKWTGGNTTVKPDPVARAEQLASAMRFAIETDTPPPDPDELLYPETPKTSSKSIKVDRVRKAVREQRERETA